MHSIALGQRTKQCGYAGWSVALTSPTPVNHRPVEWPVPTPWSRSETTTPYRYGKVTKGMEPGWNPNTIPTTGGRNASTDQPDRQHFPDGKPAAERQRGDRRSST